MGSKKVMWNLFVPFVVMFVAAVGVANADTCCQGNACQESCSKDDRYGFFAGANFLYWTTDRAGLDFAVDAIEESKGAFYPTGKMHYLDYDWDPGFRLAVGYDLGCTLGDVALVYTHFSQDADAHARSSSTADLTSTVLGPNAGDEFNIGVISAKGKTNFDYDVFDLVYSRPFCVNQCSFLRPFVGIRGLRLDQDLNVNYIPKEIDEQLKVDKFIVKNRSKYEGIGLRAGLGYSVSICSGFSLYTDMSGSIVSGRTDDHQRDLGFAKGDVVKTYVNVSDKQHTSISGYQVALGVNYDSCVWNHILRLGIGYEMNKWYDVPCIRRWTDDVMTGNSVSATDSNLLFHGLTVKASTEF